MGKMTLVAALLLGTAAVAQQPTGQEKQAPHVDVPRNQVPCWDALKNSVRPAETAVVEGARPPAPPIPNQVATPVSPTRPAGMPTC
jgi:hypothetical protein